MYLRTLRVASDWCLSLSWFSFISIVSISLYWKQLAIKCWLEINLCKYFSKCRLHYKLCFIRELGWMWGCEVWGVKGLRKNLVSSRCLQNNTTNQQDVTSPGSAALPHRMGGDVEKWRVVTWDCSVNKSILRNRNRYIDIWSVITDVVLLFRNKSDI